MLQPPEGETLGAEPFSTGTPLGVAVGPDGSLYYADLGLVIDERGIGPGRGTGSVRRIRFERGEPQPPETMAADLTFPDGLGVYLPRPLTLECGTRSCDRRRAPTTTRNSSLHRSSSARGSSPTSSTLTL